MLELRPIQAGDESALHGLLSDPKVAQWLRPRGVGAPFADAESEAIRRRWSAHWITHGFGSSLAWDGQRFVGWSLLQHTIVDGRGEVEVGWAVVRDLWGRGVGTELGRHALAAASDAGLITVVAFTRVDNAASRRVMEKLGMRHERDLERAGLPHVLYRVRPTAR